MRLDDDFRKCVVYLGWPVAGYENRITPEGTGFLVHSGGGRGRIYLVTARHVAYKLRDCPFAVRMNEPKGIGRNHYVDKIKWYYHPTDDQLDIAVTPFDPPEWADWKVVGRKSFISEQKFETKDIGPGDMAYVVGIFHLLYGKERNMPVVHTGNIALVPGDEPIPCEDWRDPTKIMESRGYLVEAQSLPASSGSPVFVRRSIEGAIKTDEKSALSIWMHGSAWLLGLWKGAWMGKPSRYLVAPPSAVIDVPLGMGIVVPAIRLIDVLDNHPELERMRVEEYAARLKAGAASLQSGDSAKGGASKHSPQSAPLLRNAVAANQSRRAPEAPASDNPTHKEDFTNLLRAASKGRKPARKTSRKGRGGS